MSSRPTAVPGWQPYDEGTERYWDGESWRGEPRPVQLEKSDPVVVELRQLRAEVAKIGSNVSIIGFVVFFCFILVILGLVGGVVIVN